MNKCSLNKCSLNNLLLMPPQMYINDILHEDFNKISAERKERNRAKMGKNRGLASLKPAQKP